MENNFIISLIKKNSFIKTALLAQFIGGYFKMNKEQSNIHVKREKILCS